MNDDFNPFALNSYFGKEYFCDREKETETLLRNIKNRNSTTIISRRRMGKTSLIQHLFNSLPSGHIGISLDIFSTNNRTEMLNNLMTAILDKIPERSNIGKRIWKFIRSLQPNISFDPLTGSPQVNINISPEKNDNYIESIFQFLENQPQKIIIAIDEFQQILYYPEENTDIWLRTFIQKLNNVVFIFSGSRTHLMSELFTNPSRPFYRSTQFINLEPIDREIYTKFIIKHFKKKGKKIPTVLVQEILNWTHGHTYYVQALCSHIFDITTTTITEESIKIAKLEILVNEEPLFLKFRDLLSSQQWKLFKAIARESTAYQITGANFIKNYHLGSSAVVLRAVKALIDKDMIYSDFDENEVKYYAVNDLFFERWAQWKRI